MGCIVVVGAGVDLCRECGRAKNKQGGLCGGHPGRAAERVCGRGRVQVWLTFTHRSVHRPMPLHTPNDRTRLNMALVWSGDALCY